MSDKCRRFNAIRTGLKKLYPFEPKGRLAQHLTILAAMISGIIGAKSVQLPKIAGKTGKIGSERKWESRVKRFSRWMKNRNINAELHFIPFAETLLCSLAHQPLTLVIDGSVVGQGCLALVVGVVYKKRVLPLAWIVVKGSKGHFPEHLHIALLEQVQALIPDGAEVILLGDGEFDGVDLQRVMNGWQWEYVCRTAKNITLYWKGHKFNYENIGAHTQPGEDFPVSNVLFSQKKYGPVMAICWWRKDCKEPIYLVTNMDNPEEACRYYAKRFRIETFFSDSKSRGFDLHKSHISDPQRLSRLMIAVCLAYYWIVYLGDQAVTQGWSRFIHRTDRCDLSLFQLGLKALEYLLDENMPIPVAFTNPYEQKHFQYEEAA